MGMRPPERRDGPVDSPRPPDSNQILQLFRSLVPPEDDKIRRDEVVGRVRNIVRKRWPDADLHQYGSTANDLCLRHADIDLCLTVPKSLETTVEEVVEELGVLLERCTCGVAVPAGSTRARWLTLVRAWEEGGKTREHAPGGAAELMDVTPLVTARVPIVNFKDPLRFATKRARSARAGEDVSKGTGAYQHAAVAPARKGVVAQSHLV